jgi:YD repeat-containing protein
MHRWAYENAVVRDDGVGDFTRRGIALRGVTPRRSRFAHRISRRPSGFAHTPTPRSGLTGADGGLRARNCGGVSRVAERTDARGVVLRYTYDDWDRLAALAATAARFGHLRTRAGLGRSCFANGEVQRGYAALGDAM